MLTDRFPLITEAGGRTLRWLEEHPHGPRYTHPGYNRVTPLGLQRAEAFAKELETEPRWRYGTTPDWVESFVADCVRNVPVYRRWGPPPSSFFDLPTTSRADLNREPWSFVPDGQPLEDLLVYNTSGTTGHPLSILTHPDTLALTIPLLQAILRRRGLELRPAPERVAVAYVTFQKQTYTYATLSPLLNECGIVKINLNPDEWRSPADRAKFLNEVQPQLYTGTPLAFAELAKLPLTVRPAALISTSMTLTAGLREQLETHFGCPVIDVYSMNESGPIAAATDQAGFKNLPGLVYSLLQPRLYIETLDADGSPTPPGARGEVTLTGGFNPYLPLLRYRTGDYASIEYEADRPYLVGLEGRPPVVFRALDGRPINNIDVSIVLRPYTIAQYHLHQASNGELRLRVRDAAVAEETLRNALLNLFGKHQPLTIEPLTEDGKGIQYTSDLA